MAVITIKRWGFPGGSDGKESACNAGDQSLIPELQPTPVFLTGKFHGQRSLAGYIVLRVAKNRT